MKQVSVVLKSLKGTQQNPDGTVLRGSIVIDGFLLDEDDKFFFLGDTLEEVSDCLDKRDVVRIMYAEKTDDEFVVDLESNEGLQ